MPDEFEYDVFLSHSSKDKAVVRPLAERLQKEGIKVWFDKWVMKAGALSFFDQLNKERRSIPRRLNNDPTPGSLTHFLYVDGLLAECAMLFKNWVIKLFQGNPAVHFVLKFW